MAARRKKPHNLALACPTATASAEQVWALNSNARVFWGLIAHELKTGHTLLMSRRELELQPSGTRALNKNSVLL